MKRWGGFVFGVLVAAGAVSAFAQSEETVNSMLDNATVAEPEIVPDAPSLSETTEPAGTPVVDPSSENSAVSSPAVPPQWVWGEVTAVDPAAGTLEIKHLDYETYEELKKTITVAKSTVFENLAGLSEMKVGDKVTIDYRPQEGLKVADMIVVEKEGEETAPAEPAVPAAAPAPVEPVALAEEAAANAEAMPLEAPAPVNAEASPGNTEAPASNITSGAGDYF